MGQKYARMKDEDKMMDDNKQESSISNKEKRETLAKFMSIPVTSFAEVSKEYTDVLNGYCARFNVESLDELMARADELEFGEEISSEILDKYSFLLRHKRQ